MALQFEYVLAGEGMGPGEEEGDALIQGLCLVVEEIAIPGMTRRQGAARNGPGNVGHTLARDADDTNTAATGRCG
jgi:hypothetical protein